MSCDYGSEAERISKLLKSTYTDRVRVEDYGDHQLVIVDVCGDFYVFIYISCSDHQGFYYEFAVGDENFAIGMDRISCLDKAADVIKYVAKHAVPRPTDHPTSS